MDADLRFSQRHCQPQRQDGRRGAAHHARARQETEAGTSGGAGKIFRRPGHDQRQLLVARFKEIRLRGLRETMTRRHLIQSLAAAPLVAAAEPAPSVKLGADLFSLRSQNWTPFQYLDYCAERKV